MQWHNKELLIGAATTDTYRLVQRGCTCRWAIIPHVPPTPDQPASPIAFSIRRKCRSTATDESTITENYVATIPGAVRSKLDVKPGDRLRWTATEDGSLRVEVVRQREGALDDFEPEPVGGDGGTAHNVTGMER